MLLMLFRDLNNVWPLLPFLPFRIGLKFMRFLVMPSKWVLLLFLVTTTTLLSFFRKLLTQPQPDILPMLLNCMQLFALSIIGNTICYIGNLFFTLIINLSSSLIPKVRNPLGKYDFLMTWIDTRLFSSINLARKILLLMLWAVYHRHQTCLLMWFSDPLLTISDPCEMFTLLTPTSPNHCWMSTKSRCDGYVYCLGWFSFLWPATLYSFFSFARTTHPGDTL